MVEAVEGAIMDTLGVPEQENSIRLPDEEWKALQRQYGNGCALCGSDTCVVPDLVVPLKLGGRNTVDNVQPLCSECLVVKQGHLIDYRPFYPTPSGNRKQGEGTGAFQVPKMLTQKHLLAVEHRYIEAEHGAVEDPILEQPASEVALLLVEEIKRLRALFVENLSLARIESVAWRERYANLARQYKQPRAS